MFQLLVAGKGITKIAETLKLHLTAVRYVPGPYS